MSFFIKAEMVHQYILVKPMRDSEKFCFTQFVICKNI